jgi:hypothetical protein
LGVTGELLKPLPVVFCNFEEKQDKAASFNFPKSAKLNDNIINASIFREKKSIGQFSFQEPQRLFGFTIV